MDPSEKSLTTSETMHLIEPYYRWLHLYDPALDAQSPFFGKEYNYDLYSETIYGYYIHPAWDNIGSETLYIKLLFVDYQQGFVIIELMGEWNDAVHNDIMHFKRNIVDFFNKFNITKYILIGENVLNFHGSDDCYYEEWFEDIEDGWIAAINFPEHILQEQQNYNIDSYINMGGTLTLEKWRPLPPLKLYQLIETLITRRLEL